MEALCDSFLKGRDGWGNTLITIEGYLRNDIGRFLGWARHLFMHVQGTPHIYMQF
jgi:hypothetical protein